MIRETASIRVPALPRKPAPARDPAGARARRRWFRAPILWLGVVLFAASIAGCILTIALALRHADAPLPVEGAELLKVPVAAASPGSADSPEAAR